jgi:hypothetical protein
MTAPNQSGELTREEIESQDAEALPERDEMSLANINLAVPVNAALAANLLSDGADAGAGASQQSTIPQSNP